MGSHRRYATPSLRRRLDNAQSAQQVGGQDRLRRRQIECASEDGRVRHWASERVRNLENDGRSPDVRAERMRSGWDGHEDEVRLAGWAAQVQRAGDPWCTARSGRAGENRPEPRGKGGCCSTQSVSARAQPVAFVEQTVRVGARVNDLAPSSSRSKGACAPSNASIAVRAIDVVTSTWACTVATRCRCGIRARAKANSSAVKGPTPRAGQAKSTGCDGGRRRYRGGGALRSPGARGSPDTWRCAAALISAEWSDQGRSLQPLVRAVEHRTRCACARCAETRGGRRSLCRPRRPNAAYPVRRCDDRGGVRRV